MIITVHHPHLVQVLNLMTYFETDSETNDTIEAELRQCMQEKRLARSECPLQWWKQNSWEVKDFKLVGQITFGNSGGVLRAY